MLSSGLWDVAWTCSLLPCVFVDVDVDFFYFFYFGCCRLLAFLCVVACPVATSLLSEIVSPQWWRALWSEYGSGFFSMLGLCHKLVIVSLIVFNRGTVLNQDLPYS